MRLILTILLIGLFKADAQMVINASSPYRPLLTGFPVDDYPTVECVYSLRKVNQNYTGAAIRVRKDTTGQPESDVGFVGNELDTAALKSFLNARSGFVTKWYDQSGKSPARDAAHTTSSEQPRIALNGVIERLNGKPSLRFYSGAAVRLPISNAAAITNNGRHWNVFCVARAFNTGGGLSPTIISWLCNGSDNTRHGLFVNITANRYQVGGRKIAADALLSAVSNTNHSEAIKLISGFLDYNGTATLFENGAETAKNTSFHNGAIENANASQVLIGARTTVQTINGNISEIIIYASNQLSQRTAIESNINAFYGIY